MDLNRDILVSESINSNQNYAFTEQRQNQM